MNLQRTEFLRQISSRQKIIREQIQTEFPEEHEVVVRLLGSLRRVAIILGGPRCGTSAVKAALATHRSVLSLPGEHRPFFTLLGRNFPDHGIEEESVDEYNLTPAERVQLISEILLSSALPSEAFTPSKAEIERFGWEWALRLPQQWPQVDIAPEKVVATVIEATNAALKIGFVSNDIGLRVRVLKALLQLDKRINPYLYDLDETSRLECLEPHHEIPSGHPGSVIVEISPFVVLRPQRLKVIDSSPDILLLKASSDAYRINMLRGIFEGWEQHFIHLKRNPFAAVNGLIDGWNFHGFWQHDLSDFGEIPSIRKNWCFDIVENWGALARKDIAELACAQWVQPNKKIIQAIEHKKDTEHWQTCFFEDFVRSDSSRKDFLKRIRANLDLCPDRLAEGAAENPEVVNQTAAPRIGRWNVRADSLKPLLRNKEVLEICEKIGYDVSHSNLWI